MQRHFIEVTNGPHNWGKFMLEAFDPSDWVYKSEVADGLPLLQARGWSHHHVLIMDLETGEGAIFAPQGNAKADLDKHRIWVCPMYEPFLEWLYNRYREDGAGDMSAWVWLSTLPNVVDLPDAPFAMAGYRRPGPTDG